MPFIRKTQRRPTRHFITLSYLNKTNLQVIAEMQRLGLWHEALDDVDVYLVPASFSDYGWFMTENHIYIPAITGANLTDLIFGRHTRLTDVLRHEWAHALADRCPELVNNKRFQIAFGGNYKSSEACYDYDPDLHFTPYAATKPCEDFAETFHHYLRHKGRLPVRHASRPHIIRKWKFMEWMTNRISKIS